MQPCQTRRPWRWHLAVTALACVAGLGGCAHRASSAADLVTIDGSSTVYPITEAVAEEFRHAHPDVHVAVGISGTGGGFQKFCRGETDIQNASRPIRDVEVAACTAAGITFVELPVAYDGITVAVHPRNTWATSMTVSELRRLWEPAAQGRVRRWSQVRPGWPDREIRLFGAGVQSGTFDHFTAAIVGTEDASRGDYMASEDDNTLVQGVANDDLALGFFGYAYYEENVGRIRAVAIDDERDANGRGAIVPTPESVRDGRYRPLTRPVFVYVNHARLLRPRVGQFVAFYMSRAADLVAEVGYIALADDEYALARDRAARRTPGSVFGVRGAHDLPLRQLLAAPADGVRP